MAPYQLSPEQIIWLNQGDSVIRYRVGRDILDLPRNQLEEIRNTMVSSGWVNALLSHQGRDGRWENGYYQPKYSSTHYTLLNLRWMEAPVIPQIQNPIEEILRTLIDQDGGIHLTVGSSRSDCCVNGMFLNIATYFKAPEELLRTLIDYFISHQLPDGGFNCQHPRVKVKHSSLHTTLSVAEGLWQYEKQGYSYRIDDVRRIREACDEFILMHHLFLSDKDGHVINPAFLSMHWPFYWRYDVMRSLEYFADSGLSYDPRMDEALNWLRSKGNHNIYPLNAPYSGKVHLIMERAGKASRINTLRAYRILKTYAPH